MHTHISNMRLSGKYMHMYVYLAVAAKSMHTIIRSK
jgi:hypothetical protein